MHTPVTNSQGQDICTMCGQIVVKPILNSDDERLQGSGFMRSGHHDDEDEYPPLPELLIELHFNGPFFGYSSAPIAPYIEIVATHIGEQSQGKIDLDDIWDDLCEEIDNHGEFKGSTR